MKTSPGRLFSRPVCLFILESAGRCFSWIRQHTIADGSPDALRSGDDYNRRGCVAVELEFTRLM